MNPTPTPLPRIRFYLTLFILGLVLSGLTAFPLQLETEYLARLLNIPDTAPPTNYTGLPYWIATVRDALRDTYARYPFIAYGTDWLAFAHLLLAVLFIGPWRDPVRNKWVLDFGLLACAAVIPLALIAGPLRGIPLYWRLIDCSFGLLGALPLYLARRHTLALERAA
jgi:succinate-acetate transporter protein